MTLKKIYSLSESDDNTDSQSDGVPQTIPGQKPQGLSKLFGGNGSPAGVGTPSNGVPQQVGRWDGPPQNAAGMMGPDGTMPTPGTPIDQTTGTSKTIPNPRNNIGGTGGPPKPAGAFSKAPNAPGNDEPLPDLPLEGMSIRSLYLGKTVREIKNMMRGPTKLAELYSIDEMPRPAGSYGAAAVAMLKWAKERAGSEFNAKDAFYVWRKAGGQPNQPDDKKAYQSFQTTLRQFIDKRGRGTPEQPLITTVQGSAGAHGNRSVYSWGAVRASTTAAAKPMPGKSAFDDMELGPAGSGDQTAQQPPQGATADQGAEEPEAQAEPEQAPEEQPSDDEFDWIPEADPETGVGRAMLALQEDSPDKLQELLAGVMSAETVMAAAQVAMKIYGRGAPMTKHGIKVAKSAAANLGLPDPDDVLG